MAARAFPINPSPALLQEVARHRWGWFRPAGTVGMLSDVAGK
jgi:hypothetical protein